jgi:peptide/nickel transport system substrate-binding protein
MSTKRQHRGRVVALVVASALAAATSVAVAAPAGADRTGSAASRAAAAPQRGGTANFGLEAETTGGFCLPDSTLAASGVQVVNAIYDTLVTINAKGEYVPYLAKSVEPNTDYTQWTITLRPGVQFQDGTPLDSAALKLNLDTYRGKNPVIVPRLGVFTWANVASVDVTGPLSVVVTTKVPWVAFPAMLSNGGRTGIVAPAQLVDRATCATKMIGTGPFSLVEWRQNESLTVRKNPNYWRKGLPYLDEIVFRPLPESQSRINGLVSGDLDLMTTSNSLSIADLKDKAAAGDIKLVVSDKGAETAFVLLNNSKPPFNDLIARQAVAYAGDARETNQIRNKGLNTISTGPFPPDNPAYVKNNTRLHSVKKAKQLNAEYQQKYGEPIKFEYLTNPEPDTLAIAQLFKEQEAKAGIDVTIRTVDQSTLVSEVIAGSFTGAGFRFHPGGDPDTQYVYWHSGSPVNFSRINDPEVDRLLDEGRSEPDPAKRTQIYRDLNKYFGKQLFNLWSWYTLWAVAYQNNVKGVAGPPLPDGGGLPFPLFGGVIPVVGISESG